MNEKLLRYLIEKGLLNTAQADALRAEHQSTLRPIRELISERGLVADDQLLEALSAVSRVPTIRLYEHAIPLEVRQLVRHSQMPTMSVLTLVMSCLMMSNLPLLRDLTFQVPMQ